MSLFPFNQLRNITYTLSPFIITEGLQHSHTVLSGDSYTRMFLLHDFPPSEDRAPKILLCPSLRSSQTAKALDPSAASATRFSFATVSWSLTLPVDCQLSVPAFRKEKMFPSFVHAVINKPPFVTAICGPRVC